jgi:hypothetical protein
LLARGPRSIFPGQQVMPGENIAIQNHSHPAGRAGYDSIMADPFPIRPVTAGEYAGFRRVHDHAFNSGPMSGARAARALRRFEPERSLTAVDAAQPAGGELVGTTGVYSLRMAVPGPRPVVPADLLGDTKPYAGYQDHAVHRDAGPGRVPAARGAPRRGRRARGRGHPPAGASPAEASPARGTGPAAWPARADLDADADADAAPPPSPPPVLTGVVAPRAAYDPGPLTKGMPGHARAVSRPTRAAGAPVPPLSRRIRALLRIRCTITPIFLRNARVVPPAVNGSSRLP